MVYNQFQLQPVNVLKTAVHEVPWDLVSRLFSFSLCMGSRKLFGIFNWVGLRRWRCGEF